MKYAAQKAKYRKGLKTFLPRVHQTYRNLVFRELGTIQSGQIRLYEGSECHCFGEPDTDLTGIIHVTDSSCYRDMTLGGSLGAAEAFIKGRWTSPGLATFIQVLARNMTTVSQLETGWAALVQPLRRLSHFLHRNTRRGSRRNIAAHYDLSNDFFQMMLDSKMMYSCAFFESDHDDLEQASTQKLDRICRKLDLHPKDRLVEIGTGWGGLAIFAAKHYGCQVTTTTISKQQFEFVKAAIAREGLKDRIELLFSDYRDLTGQFDKLVSVEMIEAVGHQYLGDYFKTCARLLKPGGSMLIQAITIPDDRYKSALREVDFIKRYIFPGGFIPSVGAMVLASADHTNLRLSHFEDQTGHYAKTLALWHQNFKRHLDHLPAHLNTPEFIRMWTYYLAYSEGGFREKVIGSAQLMFSKPQHSEPAPMTGFGSESVRHDAG